MNSPVPLGALSSLNSKGPRHHTQAYVSPSPLMCYDLTMNEEIQKPPSYDSKQVHEGVKDTAVQSPLQAPAGTLSKPASTLPILKVYSLSVEDIRMQLHNTGISKSKDSIQRYCREGSLDCKKIGMLKRFYATKQSVTNLIEKLKTDAPAPSNTRVHAGANEIELEEVQVHAGAPVKVIPETKDQHQTASNGTQVHEGADSTGDKKIIGLLEKQIGDKDKIILFMQEELTSRRGAVTALEKIIGAFDNNSKASLLNAQNEKKKMDFQHENQSGEVAPEIVQDVHIHNSDNIGPTGA